MLPSTGKNKTKALYISIRVFFFRLKPEIFLFNLPCTHITNENK